MSRLSPKEIYVVPDWMRQYLPLFNNTGGNDIEELLHDDSTTPFANIVRYMLIVSVRSQFDLLVRVRKSWMEALETLDGVSLTEVYRQAYEEARHDSLVNHEAACSLVEENEELKRRLEAAEKRIAELERSESQLIAERDNAEYALADIYEAGTGERPEWSNAFGFCDAVDEVRENVDSWIRRAEAAEKRIAASAAPQSVPSVSDLRARFEAWVPSTGKSTRRYPVSGFYIERQIRLAWKAVLACHTTTPAHPKPGSSSVLHDFYVAWDAWLDNGAVGDDFGRDVGLCVNLVDWCDRHGLDSAPALHEIHDAFTAAG
ncbi:hypothetical protein GTGU_04676, partial [Trabulsiella guamensis ATCC 49490]